MFKILPYKMGSASVKKLKEGLDAVVIKLENSVYRYRTGHTVINWGNSTRPSSLANVQVLNAPEAVAVAVNKLATFQQLESEGVPTVPYTTEREIASTWNKVFVRHSLTGHSGEGIEVINNTQREVELIEEMSQIFDEYYNSTENEQERLILNELIDTLDRQDQHIIGGESLPSAPLYTKGITNAGEYRVHVLADEVILYQKKSRRVDEEGNVITAEGSESDVRNLASNWIYRTGNLNSLERVEELALLAIRAMGLDFGAVDIIMDTDGNVYVLEVNCAPGLGNTETLDAYVNGFNSLVE